MSNALATLYDAEIEKVQDYLLSIPSPLLPAMKKFLNISSVSYHHLNDLPNPHPHYPLLDAEAALRLGIILGQLLQRYEHAELQALPPCDLPTLGSDRASVDTALGSFSIYSEYNKSSINTVHSIVTSKTLDAKFLRKLHELFRLFSMTAAPDTASINSRSRHDISVKGMRDSVLLTFLSFLSKDNSPKRDSVLVAPQTVLERPESTIELDIVFVYRTLFSVVIKIYEALRSIDERYTYYQDNASEFNPHEDETRNPALEGPLLQEEYSHVSYEIVHGISEVVVEPFMKHVLVHVVEPRVHKGFSQLLDAL